MAIIDNKITNAEVAQNHVQGVQGDRLTGTVQQNKAVFDKLPEVIVYHFNVLVEEVAELDNTVSDVVSDITPVVDAEISSDVRDVFTAIGWTSPSAAE